MHVTCISASYLKKTGFTYILFTVFILSFEVIFGQGQILLPKSFTVKYDPVASSFGEFRFIMEQRVSNNLFVFVSPAAHSKEYSEEKLAIKGFVGRAGVRQYIGTEFSPQGFFVQVGGVIGAYEINLLEIQDSISKIQVYKFGGQVAIGAQYLIGLKKNIAIGGFLGVEYKYPYYKQTTEHISIPKNFKNFTPYIGLELGFAFRQKFLHNTKK